MSRTTIDFGIDLGTTNSAIAVWQGTDVVIIKNNDGAEYTPSAVYCDKNNNYRIGSSAYERIVDDEDNASSEFKRRMGTPEEKVFSRSGKRMKPEELSAEVLKDLKASVRQKIGEEVQAAMITVPANFQLPQTAATIKAARLAGITLCPLLQEPAAAAMAYGFQTEGKNAYWMVYDFGGGTFDTSVIQIREDAIHIINNGGDPRLGGKDIDWAIVERLLIPALVKEYKFENLSRDNKKCRSAIGKLKRCAELAKIRLSREEITEIHIDFALQREFFGKNEPGELVEFNYELKRSDLAKLAEPFILKTINICKKVLSEKDLGAGDVEKILLVGGPTLAPYLREWIADAASGLGIPLEFKIDPLTVVARGAAIVAGTHLKKDVIAPIAVAGQYVLELDYRPTGAETEPLIGGKVITPINGNVELSNFTIEFVNIESQPQWRSGKIGLTPQGTFMTSLWADKGRQNTFSIELCDTTGSKCKTVPDHITYFVMIDLPNPPLPYSVGVELINNEMHILLKKNAPLPARRLDCSLKTAFPFRKGYKGDIFRVIVRAGENKRANRNQKILALEIKASEIKHDVPAGSEVEITIDMDQSRELRVKAFIPILDEEYEVLRNESEFAVINLEELKKESEATQKRMEELEKKVNEINDSAAKQIIQEIYSERIIPEIESTFAAAKVDGDAGQKCKTLLLDLHIKLDQVEDILEWPTLINEANGIMSWAQNIVKEHNEGNNSRDFKTNEEAVHKAMEQEPHDSDQLSQRIEQLRTFILQILDKKGILQVIYFQNMCKEISEVSDQSQAEQLINLGQRAITNNNYEDLRIVNRQLAALFPSPPPPPSGPTLTR